MDKITAKEARILLNRIADVEEKIKRLHNMQGWNLRIGTEHNSAIIMIPKELQETVYMLVSTAYEKKLREYKDELEKL